MYFVLRDSPNVPPAAPTGLTATWVNGRASLGWADMSSNESGFKVERRDASGAYGQIATTNQNTNIYTDTIASTSVDHCYRVKATNGTGDSAYSNESCIARQGTAAASQHLQFSGAAYPAGPSGASVTITRTGGSSGTVTVTVLVSQGTAVTGPDGDYSSPGSVAVPFAPGDTSKTVTVLQVQLQRVGNRTVNLALAGPTGDATLGSPSSAVMTIQGTGSTLGTISKQDPVCVPGLNHCAGGGLLKSGFPDPTKLAQLVSVDGAVADGVTLLVLSVPSSTPVTFSLSLPSPQYGTLMQLNGNGSANPITVEPLDSTAYVLYKAPFDLTEEILLGVSARNSVGTIIANGRIDLRHPPVVFVHGIWSDPSVFEDWENLLRLIGYVVPPSADYRYPYSADSFNPLGESVPINALVSAVQRALKIFRDKGIAVSQVDVVAHSMGGLVARAREKDNTKLRIAFNRKENRNYGEFHKLITIGTPHQGSPFADWLTLPLNKCGAVGAALNVVGRPIGQGIYDFQTTSRTLSRLGSTAVPSHAIVGRKPTSFQTASEVILNNVIQLFGDFLTVDDILGSDVEHDTQVPVVSQKGGLILGATATAVNDVIHADVTLGLLDYGITETTDPEVFGVVLQLLAAAITPVAFGPINPMPVFVPTGQEHVNLKCVGLGFAATASGVATVSNPAAGTVVRPGEVIQIVFSAPAASTSAMISIGGQLTHVTGSAGSFSTTYQLPPDATGRITIAATTLDLGAGNLSGETYIVALPSVPPAGLFPSPGSVDFAVAGLTTALTAFGTYEGGATADLTPSASGTTYSTLSGTNSVITVSADGVVQAVANGQDTIIIQNGGQTASVTATVNITNQRPTLAALADATVVAGQTLTIPLTAGDPDGHNLQLSATGLPSFVTLVDNHNGTGVLSVHPSAPDAGTYPIYISVVDDGEPALGLSRSLELTVNASPTITTQPQSQTIRSGQTATLSIGAAGTALLAYQWYVGTSGMTTSSIAGATSNSYTTPALMSTTSYWVRVSNSVGTSDSNTGTITTTVYEPFTDDTLTAGSSVIRAVHISELRARIDLVRARYSLGDYAYTTPSIIAGTSLVTAVDITEMRTALLQAYLAARLPAPTYGTNPSVGATIVLADIAALRAAVVAIE